MKKKRIAYARIAQETNVLSPLLTELSDFERTHYLAGEALSTACASHQYEARGFVKNAELSGFVQELDEIANIELVPLFSAWTVPSGQLSKECIQTLSQRLVDAVQTQGPIDGLYLSLHGAMRAEGQVDPDGDLLALMKQALGEETPVIASFDLHAVLTEHKIANADLLVAYRTNPHRDHKKIGRQCARLLLHLIAKSTPLENSKSISKLHVAWRSLPMILGGGTTLDFLPPMRGIFKRMKEMEKHPDILTASIYMCQPWHDHPDLGWASYVASEGNDALAEQYADELADLLWTTRERQPPPFTPIIEAISQARKSWLARRSGAVFFVDASDVVTAGSPGNNTLIIQSLIEHAQGLTCFVAIRDPYFVEHLAGSKVGDHIQGNLGGHLTPDLYPTLSIEGQLSFKGESLGFGQAVVIQYGTIHICVTQASPAVMKAEFYHQLGLNVWKADIVVVKNLFPWRLFCLPFNRKSIYVQTEGITDLTAAKRLEFNRDLYPFASVEDWRPIVVQSAD